MTTLFKTFNKRDFKIKEDEKALAQLIKNYHQGTPPKQRTTVFNWLLKAIS